jgi:hypothetical protein
MGWSLKKERERKQRAWHGQGNENTQKSQKSHFNPNPQSELETHK